MKGKKKNFDKKVSKKNGQSKRTLNKRSIKDKMHGTMAMKYYNTLNTKEHEEVKAGIIKRSPINLCKSVFVVVENLSPEILKKYLTTNKNQSMREISKRENIQLQKPKQSSVSGKFPSEEIQSNDNVSYIFDTKNKVDKTSLIFTKKKCTLPIKSINVSSVLKNEEERRTSESCVEDIEQTTVLNNLELTDNKITTSNLNLHAQYTDITDPKVILTKLENMDDNIYIVNWKMKCAQQALLSKNLEPVILPEDVSINSLPTETIDSSHKNVTEDSGSHMNNFTTLQLKCKQHKIPKVLLVKLEKLGISCKKGNSISTIKHSTAQCIDRFKLNFNHSRNALAYDNKVSRATNECHYSNSSITQLEENSSSKSKTTNMCSESIDNLENLEICKTSIGETEEKPALSKTQQEEDLCITKSIFATMLQKRVNKVTEKSSTKEVVLDKTSKRNSKLKKIQTLPSAITKHNISSKPNNVILKFTKEINCENIQILQKDKSVLNDIHEELNYRENQHSDVIKKAITIIKLPENMQTEQQKKNILRSNITILDCPTVYECFSCKRFFKNFRIFQIHVKKCSLRIKQMNNAHNTNVINNLYKDNENIPEISKCNNTPESSSQQKSSTLDSNSTESSMCSNISSLSTISKAKTRKRHHENQDKDELSRCKIYKNDNNNSLRCNICSELFDSMMSLSKHIYSHTKEKKLLKTYTRNKNIQNSKYINVSHSDAEITDRVTTDSNEKTQESIGESLNTLHVNSTTVGSSLSSLENKKDESTMNKVTSVEEMRLQTNMSVENVLDTLTTELNKDESINNFTIDEKISFKFCACHEKEFKKKPSMEIVLFCNVCNVLYQTMDCFKAHLENTELYLCNSTKLTRKMSKLYCNICKQILCDTKKMHKHMESHLTHFKSIKLFCHICKIRFIGMGSIFLKHWSHHDVDVFYKASVSHLPTVSIVDATSKEWSIITSDEFKYVIVTEHVCSNCNKQCFSTNELKDHMSFCRKKPDPKLSSIRLSKDRRDSDVQTELNVPVDIDKITFSNTFSSEEHTTSNQNNLKLENITEIFACKICSNTFQSQEKLMIHWKDHTESPVHFTCNQCKTGFNTFIIYIEHLNRCIKIANPVNDSRCQDTDHKNEFICNICNISFDSDKALYEHNAILKKKFPNLNTVHSNNSLFKISNCSTNQIKQNNRVAPISESMSEMSKNQNSIINQLIDSPTNSNSAKLGEIVSNGVSLSNRSITDQDLENFSSIGDDNLNIVQINNFMGNSRPRIIQNKTEKNENACKINNDSNKNDSRKDLNGKNTVIVKSANSKQKIVLDENTPPIKNIKINENDDDIILIESKILRKNHEVVKPTTDDFQLNNSTKTSEEPVKPKKYLRVRNISELIDQSSRYNMFNEQNESTSTSMSSSMAINLSSQEQTNRVNVEPHKITRSSNFQQQSVPTSSESTPHEVVIINQFDIEKQGIVHFSSEQRNPEQFLSLSSATAPTLSTTSVSTSKSAFTAESVQETMPIPVEQLIKIGNPQLPELTIIKKSQTAIPIQAPQSTQTAVSIQIPPYIASCTTQPQVSNIQYPSIRPDGNWYSMNHTYAETNTNCRTCNEQQAQNMSNNEVLINILSSPPTYSITNNYGNNYFVTQKNDELCKAASTSTAFTSTASTSTAPTFTAFTSTASTSTASNSQLTNYVSSNNFMAGRQPHNTHNLIRVQDKVCNNFSNRVAKRNSADIIQSNRIELHMNKNISIPPMSSNQYYNYNTSYAEYLPINNRNLQTSKIQTKHSSENLMAGMQKQSNNLSERTTFYRSNSTFSQSEMLFQRLPTIRFMFVCNYCPNRTTRFTQQEFDIHMNSHHNFICNICNCRCYTLVDIENHKLKQHKVDFSNIFSS